MSLDSLYISPSPSSSAGSWPSDDWWYDTNDGGAQRGANLLKYVCTWVDYTAGITVLCIVRREPMRPSNFTGARDNYS